MEMEIHRVATIFPPMLDEELAALAADIKKKGLLEAIRVDEKGRVIDGRNRLEACKRAKVEPRFETVDVKGDPLGFVVSANVKRRQLTSGQQAMAAAEAWDQAEFPKHLGKQGRAGHLAQLFGISHTYVQQARKLLQQAPDLADSVKRRDTNLTDALKVLKQRQQEQREQEKREAQEKRDLDALRRDHPDLFEQLEAGKLPLAEALEQQKTRTYKQRAREREVTGTFVNGLVRLRGMDSAKLLELYNEGIARAILAEWGGPPEVTATELRERADWLSELAKEWPDAGGGAGVTDEAVVT